MDFRDSAIPVLASRKRAWTVLSDPRTIPQRHSDHLSSEGFPAQKSMSDGICPFSLRHRARARGLPSSPSASKSSLVRLGILRHRNSEN
jgi:hypothetical protein